MCKETLIGETIFLSGNPNSNLSKNFRDKYQT